MRDYVPGVHGENFHFTANNLIALRDISLSFSLALIVRNIRAFKNNNKTSSPQ